MAGATERQNGGGTKADGLGRTGRLQEGLGTACVRRMGNRFYGAFDEETWGGARRPDYRSCFQVDRDRVIHAHAFRKLQSKTQVFLSGEYDFYRTRLTHSMEVAQIGRSICTWLLSRGAPLAEDFFIDSDLVEAVCLAHDLGHPPFGHSGERTLQELMAGFGGFEGNAQTLHLIAETMFQNESSVRGMQPTRALMDGVLKYKTLWREFPERPRNHFLYDPQVVYRDFVFGGAGGGAPASGLPAGEVLNRYKSVECQIMDWADDAAYSLNDIVDGVRAGFLTIERIEAWAADTGIDAERQHWLDELFRSIRGDRLEEDFSQKVGAFIKACRLRARGAGAARLTKDQFPLATAGGWSDMPNEGVDAQNPLGGRTNRYRFELVVAPEAEREAAFYKQMANDIIFESPQLQQMEHKARKILFDLWEAAWRNYVEPGARGSRVIRLLPPRVGRLVDAAEGEAAKARQICDWLAGLTDGMIVRTYRRLHDPDFGSLRDLS